MRPRRRHEWIFVPAWVWFEEIASKDTYKKFIAELEERGLLESNNSYRVGHYTKRFKLKLPATSEQPICFDGRNIGDFYDALWTGYGSIREIAESTGIDRTTIWRQFQKG
jgi:transcriptional regulator of acetoin/glycerol metabolism